MKKSIFQFEDPHILDFEFHVNEEFDEGKFSGFSVNSKVSNAIIEAKKQAFVKLILSVGEKGITTPFVCDMVVVAKFEVTEDVTEEFFEDLININAPALLMSYARPIIALITDQGGFKALHLPFIDFTED